jgi:hypothetical protein
MIDRSQVSAVAPADGSESPEVVERDEQSMRIVEWLVALLAFGAAIVLAVR